LSRHDNIPKYTEPFVPQFGKIGMYTPGLPDFSWSEIPKGGKYTKLPNNIPNGHKIFPMAVK
jgi:hypothetical protein